MNIIKRAIAKASTPEQQVARLAIEEQIQREEDQAKFLVANTFCYKQIAKKIPGKGIYVGKWKPKDRDGYDLGLRLNVFAAPEDLYPPDGTAKCCRTFEQTAKEVGECRSWHGYDGLYLQDEMELLCALKKGHAIGKWFIPTIDLLTGSNIEGKEVFKKHLFALKDTGAFKGTFSSFKSKELSYPDYYWSITSMVSFVKGALNSNNQEYRIAANFNRKFTLQLALDTSLLNCRPVRVELVP